MSHFTCPVVRLNKFGNNPNSDSLAVWNGPQGPLQFKRGDFKEGDLAVFAPADSMVPIARPEFAWLSDKANKDGLFRVRGIKLRGIPSVGLLVKCPDGLSENDDASSALGITKYEEPQTHSFYTGSIAAAAPDGARGVPVYDVENTWYFDGAIVEGSIVEAKDYFGVWAITEKIHGCNFKCFMDSNGIVHIGSRSRWVREDESNVWWAAYRKNQGILDTLMKRNKGHIFFGEVYGKVQDLTYGLKNDVNLVLFDMFNTQNNRFHSVSKLMTELANIENGLTLHVPLLTTFRGTFKDAIEHAKLWSGGNSKLHDGTIREGTVVRLAGEDLLVYGRETVRLMTKVISPQYSSRHGGTEYK